MKGKKETTVAVLLSKAQVTMVKSLASETLDRVWGKGGIMDLTDSLKAAQGSTADLLLGMYREAEGSKNPVETFDALAVAYEEELRHIDAKQNNGQKRKVTEIYPSWRPMRSEMKQALAAGIKSEGKTYSAIKAARAEAKGGKARAPEPKADKHKVSVSPALAASLAAVDAYIVTLDAAGQTGFAEFLTSAIARHRADATPTVADITTTNKGTRRTRAAAVAAPAA